MQYPACLTLPYVQVTFCGYPAAQTWNDLALWEAFLDRHPVKSILELGTWEGGMALFLATQCKYRGATFATVDQNLDQLRPKKELLDLGVTVSQVDLHSPEGVPRVRELLSEMAAPRLLFCDDGSKRHEWKTFVPLLSTGDFAAVHDWGSEFGESDLDPDLPYVMREECESVSSLTRFFVVP